MLVEINVQDHSNKDAFASNSIGKKTPRVSTKTSGNNNDLKPKKKPHIQTPTNQKPAPQTQI